MKLALLGDVHGKGTPIVRSFELLNRVDMVIQLGDFGYGPWPIRTKSGLLTSKTELGAEQYLEKIDPTKYKVIPGNHDNPESYSISPHCLGRYGSLILGGTKIFFIGGAYSIDKDQRIPDLEWWDSEQLNYEETNDCIEQCIKFQPDIILSHDCPITIAYVLTGKKGYTFDNPSWTNRLLTEIEKQCQPHSWYFGHYHTSWKKKLGNTLYRCLDINEYCIIGV